MAALVFATLAILAVFTIVAWDESPVILKETMIRGQQRPKVSQSEELVAQMLDLAQVAQSSTRDAAGSGIEKKLIGHAADLEMQAAQMKKRTDEDMALFVEVEDHSRRSAAATTATTVQASPDVRLDEDGEDSFVPYQDLVATMLKLEKEASKSESLDQLVDIPVDSPTPSAETPDKATDEVEDRQVVQDDEVEQINIPDDGPAVLELLLEKDGGNATEATSATEKPTIKRVAAAANISTMAHAAPKNTTQSKAVIAENAVAKAAKTEKNADRAQKKTDKAAADSTSAMIDAAKAHHAAQKAKKAAANKGDTQAIASAQALQEKAAAKIKKAKQKSKKAKRRTKKSTKLLTKAKQAEEQASVVSPVYLALQAKLHQTEGRLQNVTDASNGLRQQLKAQSATMKKMEEKLQKGTQDAHYSVAQEAKKGTQVQQQLERYKTKLNIAQTALTAIYQAVGSKLTAEGMLQS